MGGCWRLRPAPLPFLPSLPGLLLRTGDWKVKTVALLPANCVGLCTEPHAPARAYDGEGDRAAVDFAVWLCVVTALDVDHTRRR